MSKKNTKTSTTGDLPSLKLGSRVRCTDDGVTGRIAWANAVSVKIKWDDGGEVTWKRDSLATRPVEILDTDEEVRDEPTAAESVAEQVEDPATEPEPEQGDPTELITPAAETGLEQANGIEPQVTDVATTALAEQPGAVLATESVAALARSLLSSRSRMSSRPSAVPNTRRSRAEGRWARLIAAQIRAQPKPLA